ncbi:head GIN domain-containing protein [Haloflavibacter putidus]|uniref:DUF2807 domain-containing protein n=1 Tax=Haloflavibacter putidus TaxID=2576776 RepID=A0A507ZU87_9FLAO|nr:head GIN domain-containing protein [Haloflavibacter putidus]TQD39824.1 DUF2807 domain-containing protein [Haloflavibacter putidus]
MKYFLIIVMSFILSACSADWTPDCFRKEGEIISKEIALVNFEEIEVHAGVELFLSKANTQKVVLETGENLAEDITFKLVGNKLVIKNKNTCNFVRDYKVTKVYIESPDLKVIRNASSWTINSLNTLTYDTLQLISEDASLGDTVKTDGDFDLDLQCNSLTIVSNGLSDYFLDGEVANFSINFYSGDGRLESENLLAENIEVYHRGSNTMVINPQQSLIGKIVSTGNILAKNEPPLVQVEELYTGRLLFE